MRRPAFTFRAFFCRFGRISFLFPALPFYRCADSLFPLPKLFSRFVAFLFLLFEFSFYRFITFLFYSLCFPSNTFHRRTLAPFLVPSSPVSIPSQSPPRKNFEKRSLKTIFLNDKTFVKRMKTRASLSILRYPKKEAKNSSPLP